MPGHYSKGWMLAPACSVCKKKHSELLHMTPTGTSGTPTVSDSSVGNGSRPNSSDNAQPGGPGRSFLTGVGTGREFRVKTVPVKVICNNRSFVTNALLGDCSDVTLCSDWLAQMLQLDGEKRHFSVLSVNKEASIPATEVSFNVLSLDGNEQAEIRQAWNIAAIPVKMEESPELDAQSLSHLSDISFPSVKSKDIDLLIGADNPEDFWTVEERRRRRKETFTVKTILGWSLVGPVGSCKSDIFHVNFTKGESALLQEQIEKLWMTDFSKNLYSSTPAVSVEDRRALTAMDTSVALVDGHYQLSLLWKHTPPQLSNNQVRAESWLKSLKRPLQKDQGLHEKYNEIINEYERTGIATRLPSDAKTRVEWYLPHHPVINPRKHGKVRVVFDCAAKDNNQSLNDQLLRGPDFTNNLVGVISRFREQLVAIISDIKGMFNQVMVTLDDRRYLGFLWWLDGELTADPETYTMNVHLFGATSSPSFSLHTAWGRQLLITRSTTVRRHLRLWLITVMSKTSWFRSPPWRRPRSWWRNFQIYWRRVDFTLRSGTAIIGSYLLKFLKKICGWNSIDGLRHTSLRREGSWDQVERGRWCVPIRYHQESQTGHTPGNFVNDQYYIWSIRIRITTDTSS